LSRTGKKNILNIRSPLFNAVFVAKTSEKLPCMPRVDSIVKLINLYLTLKPDKKYVNH
jgi:hypothetical protein